MASQSPTWTSLLGLGAVVAAILVAAMALGWLVDSVAGTSPIFVLVGLGLGLAAAIAYAVNRFKLYLKA